jgi:hypothetical protein
VDGKLLLIECKRPVSVKGAKESIGKARKQLQRELKTRSAGARGVIAVSMSKIMSRGDRIFGYDTEPNPKAARGCTGICASELIGSAGRG